MRIWLTNPWEPNPCDDLKGRLWRTGILANMMVERGHEVVWWASNFRHVSKEFRFETARSVRLGDRYTLRVLPALGYDRNVSLERLRDHRYVAREFRQLAKDALRPDIVLASYPTIDLAQEAVRFGMECDVPVVVDVRDQWPDTFLDAFPPYLRWAVRLMSIPLSRQADWVFTNATAVTGHGLGAVEWAMRRAGREAGELDRAFPMGFPRIEFSEEALADARSFWRDHGIVEGSDRMVVAFMGSMTRHFDFETVLAAAARLERASVPVTFVCCGSGEQLDDLRSRASAMPNVVFPGWVEAPEIHILLRSAAIGIAPYEDRKNFEDGITNKPAEYLSAGLPIATTLQRGVLRETLERTGTGIFYRIGDPDSLAAQLTVLHEKPSELQQMRNRARDLFEAELSAEKVYDEMIAHLGRVRERYIGS